MKNNNLINMNPSPFEDDTINEKITFIEKFSKKKIQTERIYVSLEDAIEKYDQNNLIFFEQMRGEAKSNINKLLEQSYEITPSELQQKYGNKVIDAINSIKKSQIYVDLPKLPFGKQLSDDEFLDLLNKCVCYANYHLTNENLNKIREKLLQNSKIILNIFKTRRILKDLLENALLTILTSDDESDQADNFDILCSSYISTITPFAKLEFNNNNNTLDKKELIETLCSKVHLKNYYESLDEFIPNFKNIVKSEEGLKVYINVYLQKYNIYFCKLPQNIMAITIHTGNIYLKADYLEEYFNKTDLNSQIIIREKIVLNLSHELMHGLIRIINPEMAENFFDKSEKKTKVKDNQIEFKDKFVSNFYSLNANESGNVFDHNFYEGYYFGELYEEEAFFFLDIKKLNSIDEYKNKLNSIILGEKKNKVINSSVNKFKKLKYEKPHCKRP